MRSLLLLLPLSLSLFSQTVVERRPYIRASGEGVVSVRPDQVKVNAGVITTANTAEEASEQNAAITAKVIADVRTLIGGLGEIRTVSIHVSPVYRNQNGTSTITGYTASNQLEITLNDTALAGRVIDTATRSGANSIGAIRFSIKDPSSARQQALRLATQQARLQADAIATGLGGRAGRVLAAVESYVSSPGSLSRDGAAAPGIATTTPVETGTLEVRASVTIETEILN